MSDYYRDPSGVIVFRDVPPEADSMMFPARCNHCFKVYDLAAVTVTARYADCSMWKTPCCKRTVDDRGETGWKPRADYTRLGQDR